MLLAGMKVDFLRMNFLEQLKNVEQEIDITRDKVNALVRQKMSLEMTYRELINLGAEDNQLISVRDKIEEVMQEILAAAEDLAEKVSIYEQMKS